MLDCFKTMTDVALDMLSGVPSSAQTNQPIAPGNPDCAYQVQPEKLVPLAASSAVGDQTGQAAVPRLDDEAPVLKSLAGTSASSPRRDTDADSAALEKVALATTEHVVLIADRLEAIKTDLVVFSRNTTSVEALTKTVDQQMEIIRELSRRVRDLDDQIISGLVIRPMLNGLMLLHDCIATHLRNIAAGGVVDSKTAFSAIAAEVNELLAQYGVTAVRCDGGVFDPKLHKVVGTVPEKTPRENEIAEVKRIGFEKDGALLRRSEVVIVKAV